MQRLSLFLTLVAFGCVIGFSSGCKHQPYIPTAIVDTTGGGTDTTGSGDTTHSVPQIPCSPDSVYFSRQVLPILNSNCATAGCHDGTSKEDDVQSLFTSYDNTMKSAAVKKNASTSRSLYWYITLGTGDKHMPPSGYNQLTAEQKAIILKWMDQGKKDLYCDECDTTNITFTSTIYPLMVTNCKGCHTGTSPGGNISLNTYTDIKTIAIDPTGRFIGALLHDPKFKPMPNNTKLSDCDINKIKIWIRAGTPNN